MERHAAVHVPHPLHRAALTSETSLSWRMTDFIFSSIALNGQTRSQSPQATHLISSTKAIVPSASIKSLERTVHPRDTAAFAWEIDSSISFGECAKPARSTPSVANSTGRSFMCASRKNPSAFSGTFSIWASTSLSAGGSIPALNTKESASISRIRFTSSSFTRTLRLLPFFLTCGGSSLSNRMKTTPNSRAC